MDKSQTKYFNKSFWFTNATRRNIKIRISYLWF